MRITTQLTVVIVVGIVGFVGMIVSLAVLADWSDGAIIGMATAFGAVIVNTVIAVRNQQRTVETLLHQDEKLDTITAQTNGLSDRERQDIAHRAALTALAQTRKDG